MSVIVPPRISWSLSARRAWIEILWLAALVRPPMVALRKESVDRNVCSKLLAMLVLVALRKESVDRNVPDWAEIARREASLSARRAWIEILVVWNHMLTVSGRSPQGERG